jgi:hypothetical protein
MSRYGVCAVCCAELDSHSAQHTALRNARCNDKKNYSVKKSLRIRIVEKVARRVEIHVCRILVGEAKGKRLFEKHRYEGEDNDQNDIQEV